MRLGLGRASVPTLLCLPRRGVQQCARPGEPLTFVFLLSFQSWTHNIQREKEFLRKLVKARVITDLTSGI